MEIFCCGDDGIAWHASDELERTFSPAEVELLRLHQLTPELAETVGHYEAVIFVNADASGENTNLGPGQVRCEEVRSKSKVVLFEDIVRPVAEGCFSHRLSPKAIITLAHQLYGANSRAFTVTLTGKCFDHSEALSPVAIDALPALVARVEDLVRQLRSARAFSF